MKLYLFLVNIFSILGLILAELIGNNTETNTINENELKVYKSLTDNE